MQFSILTLTGLLATALSMPVSSRQTSREINTGLMAVRSASPIHFEAVNATGNSFWIFKDTTTFCPYAPPEQVCSYPNRTEIAIYPDSTEYQVYMDANVPGGQNVYVAPNGALSFTTAHEEYVFPNGSYTSGFEYTTNENNVSFLTFTAGGATSWFACPATTAETETSYKVFANVGGFNDATVPSGKTSDCLEFGIVVANPENSSTQLGAWQYE